MVLLTLQEYRELLEQNVLAPKVGKYNPLSAKQKRKVEDKIAASCLVVMNMTTVGEQPLEVQRKVAETMH